LKGLITKINKGIGLENKIKRKSQDGEIDNIDK
jgi:hypothetical protein